MKLLTKIVSIAILVGNFSAAYASDIDEREVKTKQAVTSYFGAERVEVQIKKLESELLPSETLQPIFTAIDGHVAAVKSYSKAGLAVVDDATALANAEMGAQSRIVLAKLALSRLQLSLTTSGAMTEAIKEEITKISKSLTDLIVVVATAS